MPDGVYEIPLHGRVADSRVARVDAEDYELVSAYRWVAYQVGTVGPYAVTYEARHRRGVYMHKMITGWPMTDHINHDGLDNRRQNLRPATHAQNNRNQRPKLGGTSEFKGVRWFAARGKWIVQIRGEGKRHVGCFTSEIAAALAYDAAARERFGDYACLNFPETADLIRVLEGGGDAATA